MIITQKDLLLEIGIKGPVENLTKLDWKEISSKYELHRSKKYLKNLFVNFKIKFIGCMLLIFKHYRKILLESLKKKLTGVVFQQNKIYLMIFYLNLEVK